MDAHIKCLCILIEAIDERLQSRTDFSCDTTFPLSLIQLADEDGERFGGMAHLLGLLTARMDISFLRYHLSKERTIFVFRCLDFFNEVKQRFRKWIPG